MPTYGYARVSTEGEDLEPQLVALQAARCGEIIEEKASGTDRNRPELAQLLGRLRRGDRLVVVRIDRLARPLAHLLAMLDRLQAAGVHFRSLSDPIDTATPTGRLVVQVIGAIAEFDRRAHQSRACSGQGARPKARQPRFAGRRPQGQASPGAGQKRARPAALLPGPDAWLPTVRRLRRRHAGRR